MERLLLLFLFVWTFGANAATFGVVGAPLCGYGMYKYNGACVPLNQMPENCSEINGVGTYRVPLDASSFLYREAYGTNPCQGTHTLYEYNNSVLIMLSSSGTLRSFGAPMCGYGQYRLGGKCYTQMDADARSLCPDNFHKTVSDTASFMDLNSQGISCQGTYNLYEYSELFHPLFNGILLSVGAALQTASDMRLVRCSVNPDEYYQIATDATEEGFGLPELGMCANDTVKYSVKSDCKDVNVANASNVVENSVCAVLCDSGVYSNLGVCASGYCMMDGRPRRLYYSRGGASFSIPMYASKLTTPSINIRVADGGGVCYVNLVETSRENTIHVSYGDRVYSAMD